MGKSWQERPLWARLLIIFLADVALFFLIGVGLPAGMQMVFYVVCVLAGAYLMWREMAGIQRRRSDLERQLQDRHDDWMRRLPDMFHDEDEEG